MLVDTKVRLWIALLNMMARDLFDDEEPVFMHLANVWCY
jgi:hypothetical protein